MAEDRAGWTVDLLATSIQISGLSEEEVERKLGWSPGAVGRILEREEDLGPGEALRVLTELGVDSGPDGETWYLEDGQTQVVTHLLERFRRLGYGQPMVAAPGEELELAKLEKQVQAILQEAFGEKGRR